MLTALIGLPRSGKDTFCYQWVKEEENRIWISRDDVRLTFHGKRFEALLEDDVNTIYKNAVKTILRCNPHIHLMLNETNCSVKAVRTVLNQYDENANFIFIDCPRKVCRERAVLSGQEDLLHIIDRMYEGLLNLALYSDIPIEGRDYDQYIKLVIPHSIEKIRCEVMGKEKFRNFHNYFKDETYSYIVKTKRTT